MRPGISQASQPTAQSRNMSRVYRYSLLGHVMCHVRVALTSHRPHSLQLPRSVWSPSSSARRCHHSWKPLDTSHFELAPLHPANLLAGSLRCAPTPPLAPLSLSTPLSDSLSPSPAASSPSRSSSPPVAPCCVPAGAPSAPFSPSDAPAAVASGVSAIAQHAAARRPPGGGGGGERQPTTMTDAPRLAARGQDSDAPTTVLR